MTNLMRKKGTGSERVRERERERVVEKRLEFEWCLPMQKTNLTS